MNAKRLLCILALVSSAFGPLRAQNPDSQRLSRLFFQQADSRWTRNVCGMMPDRVMPICGLLMSDSMKVKYRESREYTHLTSSASLYSSFEHGDFRPGHAASSLWKTGAEARTDAIYNNWKATYMTGRFSFEEKHGEDMRMSMFINPGYYPIDVIEFTPGDKILQTYRFSGGIARELWHPAWCIGGKIDFSSQNYSKRKDIRHTNYALDLTVVPSILYRDYTYRFGLSGIFRKTAESIEAEQVGAATADTYYAFFDKGMRYGTYQAWDGSGIHLAEAGVNRLPVREFSYGAAIQFGNGYIYADAEYLRTDGLVGEKGYDWYRFPGHKLTANASWRHLWKQIITYFSFHADWRGQRLDEAAWDKVTDGGITLPEIYGYNTVSRRRQTNLSVDYQTDIFFHTVRSFKLGYSATIWDEHASPHYPYTDAWHIWMSRLNANVVTGLPFGGIAQRFTLALGARYFWANDRERGLEPADPTDKPWGDGANTGDSTSSSHGLSVGSLLPASEPFRLDFEWVRRHEYLTASGMGLNGALTYRIKSVKGLSLTLDGSWTHAFEITLLKGKNRWTSSLRLGYSF